MVGHARPERVFSVGHTGGDLSLPDEVKAKVMPKPFPVLEMTRWGGLEPHRLDVGTRRHLQTRGGTGRGAACIGVSRPARVHPGPPTTFAG